MALKKEKLASHRGSPAGRKDAKKMLHKKERLESKKLDKVSPKRVYNGYHD